MYTSTLTTKGQTTIPKEIRDHLHLQPEDRIIYVLDGDKVYLTYVQGNILDLKDIARHKVDKPIDFKALREQVKAKVARDVKGKMG